MEEKNKVTNLDLKRLMKLINSYQDWNKKEKIKNYPEEKYKKNTITDNIDIKRMVREVFEQKYVKFKNFNDIIGPFLWGIYLWQIHVDIWQNQYNIVKLKN